MNAHKLWSTRLPQLLLVVAVDRLRMGSRRLGLCRGVLGHQELLKIMRVREMVPVGQRAREGKTTEITIFWDEMEEKKKSFLVFNFTCLE
jgi:hypothetical protein